MIRQTKPGLVALYDILPGNGTGPFLQPRSRCYQSVISPTLFNLYTNDLPVTGCRKFISADDISLTKQAQRYSELECCLSSDKVRMASYCRLWRLKPSPMKTVISVFHLLNTSATRELRVHIEGQLRHDPNPVYIGVTLDRTLSYWQHLQRLPESYKPE